MEDEIMYMMMMIYTKKKTSTIIAKNVDLSKKIQCHFSNRKGVAYRTQRNVQYYSKD